MVKFLIALAELFSSFAAKLHNLSEEVPSDSIDHEQVLDIVQDAINEGHLKLPSNEEVINPEDLYCLDRFVDNQIDTYDFDGILDRRLFEEQTMALVNTYAFENRMDCANISWDRECQEMREYMHKRWEVWSEERKNREARKRDQIIKEYLKSQECPPSPHRLIITNHKDGDVKI